MAALLSLLPAALLGHITMNPNYGAASGGYFTVTMKIPHGTSVDGVDYYTTRIEMELPHGLRTARPEVPAGWNVTIEEYTLGPHQIYVSHGRAVTTGPSKITFQALTPEDGLHNDHLLQIDLQTSIGCDFADNATNTWWTGQHTLWFKTLQYHSSPGTLDIHSVDRWIETQRDTPDGISPSWSCRGCADKPSPYVYIYAGTRCSWSDSTGAVTASGGMNWFGQRVEPVANRGAVLHEQHVIELANEAALTAVEANAQTSAFATHASLQSVDDDANQALYIAIVALTLSALSFGFLLGLCVFRLTAKKAFAEIVSAVPLMNTYGSTTGAEMKSQA